MRVKLATTLKNKTSSLARDARLLNSVVDSKNRVQKRPSLVGAFGPVNIGNGLGLFVRNPPIGPRAAAPELIVITGGILTTSPSGYVDQTHVLTSASISSEGTDYVGFASTPTFAVDIGSISPTTYAGATIYGLVTTNATTTYFALSGNRVQGFFTSIVISSGTILSSAATRSYVGALDYTVWQWDNTNFITQTGTIPVNIS